MKSTIIINMVSMEFLESIDRVYIFDRGHIEEEGKPYELLKNNESILYNEVKEIDPDVIGRVFKTGEGNEKG